MKSAIAQKKIHKNRKIDFSFDSSLYASFMKMGEKLRGGGGSAYSYLEQSLIPLGSKLNRK